MFLSERGMFAIHKNEFNSIVEMQEYFILPLFMMMFQVFVLSFKNIKVINFDIRWIEHPMTTHNLVIKWPPFDKTINFFISYYRFN